MPPTDDADSDTAQTTPHLLATLIHSGQPVVTTVGIAERLLAHFGGLRGLLQADTAVVSRQRGMSTSRAVRLAAVATLAHRFYTETLQVGKVLASPKDTQSFLTAKLRDLPHEVFAIIFLDTRHRVLGYEALFRGTIDGTSVYPREVVKRALHRNAAALIVAHNHPSGVAEPSSADGDITRRLADALALVDIRLLDHIVIGDGESVSLAGRGLL